MKKKKEREHRDIQTFFFLISAAKIWCFSRSVINYNSSNCATRLSMHMKYQCEPRLSFNSTYIQRAFIPRIDWLNNRVHSISGVPIFYCVTNYQKKNKKKILFYCFEHLYMKDIISQEQFFISPVHFTLEVNTFSTKHIKLTDHFKSGTANHKYLHSLESGLP